MDDFFESSEKFDYDNIVNYLSNLQLLEDQGDYPAGMFGVNIMDGGDIYLESHNVIRNAHRVVKFLDLTNNLDKINLDLLANFVSKMYITEDWNKGLFKHSLFDDHGNIYDYNSGKYLADLSNFTLYIDLKDTFENTFDYLKYNPHEASDRVSEVIEWNYYGTISIETIYEYIPQDVFKKLLKEGL